MSVGGSHGQRFVEAEYQPRGTFTGSPEFGDGYLDGDGGGAGIKEDILHPMRVQYFDESFRAFILFHIMHL